MSKKSKIVKQPKGLNNRGKFLQFAVSNFIFNKGHISTIPSMGHGQEGKTIQLILLDNITMIKATRVANGQDPITGEPSTIAFKKNMKGDWEGVTHHVFSPHPDNRLYCEYCYQHWSRH